MQDYHRTYIPQPCIIQPVHDPHPLGLVSFFLVTLNFLNGPLQASASTDRHRDGIDFICLHPYTEYEDQINSY